MSSGQTGNIKNTEGIEELSKSRGTDVGNSKDVVQKGNKIRELMRRCGDDVSISQLEASVIPHISPEL